MPITEVHFYSRKVAELLPPGEMIISICSPGAVSPRLIGWKHVLPLCFDDFEVRDVDYPKRILFGEEHAASILKFLDCAALFETVTTFVHCEGGFSRSAAVARFICDLYDLPFNELRGAGFNRLVYRILTQAAQLKYRPGFV